MTCLFVEQLTVIDCALLDARRGLVGESWIVDLELEGELDEQSMVLDFGEVKRRLKRAIDDSADHSLLVPLRAGELSLHDAGDAVELEWKSARGAIEHRSPSSAVTLLDAEQVDAAAVVRQLQPAIAAAVPPNVASARLLLRHETIDGPWYRYTHGLRKHEGHCQRIAHGHRSRIEISVDGRRDTAQEAAWAARWTDIYLGTRADISAQRNGRLRFEYTASEGAFALELPEAHCDLLDGDSTVERIAEHLAGGVSSTRPGQAVLVRAYEGVQKGAVARRL